MAHNLSKQPDGGIRTFVAIELPPPVRTTLSAIEDRLRQHADVLKLVAPELLHLTVRFLGNVAPARLAAVESAVREAAAGVQPFSLRLATVGSFGGSSPRVIWVGLCHDAGLEALQRLYRRLEDALHTRGFERERRPLSPHLTIARVRDDAPLARVRDLGEAVARLTAEPAPSASFDVTGLTVMRSDLSSRGPRYAPMVLAPLGEGMEGSRCASP